MMLKHLATVLGVTALVLTVSMQAQQPAPAGRGRGAAEPAPPAPPPGSAGTFRSGDELMEILKKNIAAAPDQASSPISITDQYRVTIVHRGKAAGAITHAGNTELHYILDGAGTMVTGGTIQRPAAGAAGSATIQGGETRRMKKGDVIVIPANSPHWYKDVEGTITYLEVRFVAPAK